MGDGLSSHFYVYLAFALSASVYGIALMQSYTSLRRLRALKDIEESTK